MSIESVNIPFVITPADIEAIVRRAQAARTESIRIGLLQLSSQARAWAARLRAKLNRQLPEFGI